MDDVRKHIKRIVELANLPLEDREAIIEDILQTYTNTILASMFEAMSPEKKEEFKKFLSESDKNESDILAWLEEHVGSDPATAQAMKEAIASASEEILDTLTRELEPDKKELINQYISTIA